MAANSTDFLRKNQQHIQQLMVQRQHDLSVAQAAVISEERQRQKLRQKVLSMRENRPTPAELPAAATEESKTRTLGHSETMPTPHQSKQNPASPPRRCLSALNSTKQQVQFNSIGAMYASHIYPELLCIARRSPQTVTWQQQTARVQECPQAVHILKHWAKPKTSHPREFSPSACRCQPTTTELASMHIKSTAASCF